jgi:hypothetical protein
MLWSRDSDIFGGTIFSPETGYPDWYVISNDDWFYQLVPSEKIFPPLITGRRQNQSPKCLFLECHIVRYWKESMWTARVIPNEIVV